MNSSPWAKFTTSMMPKMRVSPEATRARIMPLTIPFTIWTRIWSKGITGSHSQVLVDDAEVPPELGRGGVVADDALFHDVDAVGCLQRERDVLLDEQDGHAFLVQHVNDLANLGDHARHEPFGGLVEQDDARLQHHGPGDGQHLLLAAR